MSSEDLSLFLGLPDELLDAVFHAYLYREDQFADDIQYDDISALCTPFSIRYFDFASAFLYANRRFYHVAIAVLWRCVVLRSPKDLTLVANQTKDGCRYTGSKKLGSLTRRLELQFAGPYSVTDVRNVLGRMGSLRVLVARNYHLRRGNGFMPSPAHLFEHLQLPLPPFRRFQLDTALIQPTRRDVLQVLIANPTITTLRVSRFHRADLSIPQWTPPASARFSSQLTTLSLGSIDPYDDPTVNLWIASFLSALIEHFSLPMLTSLDLFEPTSTAIPFLSAYGSSLRRLAYAVPHDTSNEVDDSWVYDCPNLEELVWVMRGWGAAAPPEDGHDGVSKVAIYYIKDEEERRSDCIQQLGDAVDGFCNDAWPALQDLEVIVRGRNVPSFRQCEWDDHLVLDVQTLDRIDGWRAVMNVDALTS